METLGTNIAVCKDILDVNIYDTADKVRKSACDAIFSFADGEKADPMIKQ